MKTICLYFEGLTDGNVLDILPLSRATGLIFESEVAGRRNQKTIVFILKEVEITEIFGVFRKFEALTKKVLKVSESIKFDVRMSD